VSPVRGGNAYLLLEKPKQQRGLSTPFGWRLTALKMTELSEIFGLTLVKGNPPSDASH
jgi:hypothetical protein